MSIDDFEKELIELMKKHDVSVEDAIDYDENDGPCGTEYRFQKNGEGYSSSLNLKDLE